MKKINSKKNALEWSQHFFNYQSMGIIPDALESAANSALQGLIWPNNEPFREFIIVLVFCINEENTIKNKGARVVTTLFIEFLDAQWQLLRSIKKSPAAIIRNAKIGNIILLHAFFRTLSSNLDLEYPAVSEENCLMNLLPLPWPLISWEFRHFLGFLKSGGKFKWCNSHVTAYISVLKFLQVSVKSITNFKIVIAFSAHASFIF